MLRKSLFILLTAALWTAPVRAGEWSNLTPENRLGGRMVSAGYLRGKVVLLDCRDYGDKANFPAIRSLQETWAAYKSKPFVIVGSHRGADTPKRLAKILERLGVTYPVYAGAALEGIAEAGDSEQRLYVLDSTGSVRLYSGADVRTANGALGTAIFATIKPTTAKQWKRLLDYEIENLPGQAYLRLKSLQTDKEAQSELRTAYPEDLKRYGDAYAKFKEDVAVKKLAKLVDLARLVKDRDTSAPVNKRITKAALDKQIDQYESLKESVNPFIAQEAKNAIADLMFVQATLPK